MKNKSLWLTGFGLMILSVIWTVLIRTVDVAAIGPAGTSIGLSSLNGAVRAAVGEHLIWYKITQLIGYVSLLFAAFFGLCGLIQWIKCKNILKVDREILALGVLFAIVIGLYFFFEVVIVNYRPVLMDGSTAPEASFPSSHTMLACVVFGGMIAVLGKYVKGALLRRVLRLAAGAVILIAVIGRLLSGVHWFTDIVAAVLISASLLTLFAAAIRPAKGEKNLETQD